MKGEYIKRLRYKTQTYGEWRLWDVTQKGIVWMQQLHHEDVPTVIVTKDGKPVEYLTEGSNRSAKLANAWAGLTKRAKKDHESFRELSFNKLRKTAGDMIRDIAGGDVPLSRSDRLRRPDRGLHEPNFAKVFEAIKVMGERLAPVFAKGNRGYRRPGLPAEEASAPETLGRRARPTPPRQPASGRAPQCGTAPAAGCPGTSR